MTPEPVRFVIERVPLPPSVNRHYEPYTFVTSRRWRSWQENFGKLLMTVRRPKFTGPYMIELVIPEKTRGDVDNLLKCPIDALVKFEIVPDDRHCIRAECRRSPGRAVADGCMLIVRKPLDLGAAA